MPEERLIVAYDPAEESSVQISSMNERPLIYRIIISEDPLNEDITPAYEYGAKLQTDYYLNILKRNLPQLD